MTPVLPAPPARRGRAGSTSWRERARRWQERGRRGQERARRWQALATTPGGAAILLAASALFACAIALFSANPPERLWGLLAAGPYAVAAIAALAGRPGPGSPSRSAWPGPSSSRWPGWPGPGGDSPRSAWSSARQGCSCITARPTRARTRWPPRTTRTSTTRTCRRWPCSGSRTHSSAAACSPIRGCGSGWCSCSASPARWLSAACHGRGCGPRWSPPRPSSRSRSPPAATTCPCSP